MVNIACLESVHPSVAVATEGYQDRPNKTLPAAAHRSYLQTQNIPAQPFRGIRHLNRITQEAGAHEQLAA